MKLPDPKAATSRLAHKLLRLIPPDTVFPVLSGANRGRRWMIGAGIHRCWLGTYERQELAVFLGLLGSADVMWDIGAHAGYFTLACASHVREIVACEALPANAERLRRHLALNHVGNVTVVDAAINDKAGGTVTFGSNDSYQGRIGQGAHTVRSATIDELVESGLPAPTVIKMDIEGSEADALKGAKNTLGRHHPTFMLAFHSEVLRVTCQELLQSHGYKVTPLNSGTFLARYSV